MSRAARLALGVALSAAVLPGCGGNPSETKTPDDSDPNYGPPYGIAPLDEPAEPDAGTEREDDADAGVPAEVYGAPPE
jgi:hypothetical protein